MIWTFLAVVAIALLVFPWLRERWRDPVEKIRPAKSGGAAPDASSSGILDLSDGETWYEWHGETSDSVIVLVHGLTTPSWVFSGLLRGLNMMGYQVLTYDLYGRGFSGNSDAPQTPQFFLRQLTELLDALGLEGPVSLMGYSMGGAIVSLFASTHPERVDRLVLLAPAGIDYAPPQPLKMAGHTGHLGDWIWSLTGAWVLRRAAHADAAGPTVVVDIDARMKRETGRRGYLAAVMSSHRETLLVDLEEVYRDVGKTKIPVLAIWGDEDRTIPRSAIGKLTQWNRRVRHHVTHRAGHSLPHTAPNDVIAAITAFLKAG